MVHAAQASATPIRNGTTSPRWFRARAGLPVSGDLPGVATAVPDHGATIAVRRVKRLFEAAGAGLDGAAVRRVSSATYG